MSSCRRIASDPYSKRLSRLILTLRRWALETRITSTSLMRIMDLRRTRQIFRQRGNILRHLQGSYRLTFKSQPNSRRSEFNILSTSSFLWNSQERKKSKRSSRLSVSTTLRSVARSRAEVLCRTGLVKVLGCLLARFLSTSRSEEC